MRSYLEFIGESHSHPTTPCDLMRVPKEEWIDVVKTAMTIPNPASMALEQVNAWFLGHVGPHREEMKRKTVDTLLMLRGCSGRLPWFGQVTVPRVYRGLRRPITDLRRMSLARGNRKGIVHGTMEYDPAHPVQSWTTSPTVAMSFHGMKPTPISVDGRMIPDVQLILSIRPSREEVLFGDVFHQVHPMTLKREAEVVIVGRRRKVTVAVNVPAFIHRAKEGDLPWLVGEDNAKVMLSAYERA